MRQSKSYLNSYCWGTPCAQNTGLRMKLILSEESGAERGSRKLLSSYMVWFRDKAISGIISKGRGGEEEGDRDMSLKIFPFTLFLKGTFHRK